MHTTPTEFSRPNKLQRSRTRVSAEGHISQEKAAGSSRLQRSRTRVSAEGQRPRHLGLGRRIASTEPHSCECGRMTKGMKKRRCRGELQRSRTRVSAEGPLPSPSQKSSFHASTEPHSCECGRYCMSCKPREACSASTEPHSCECGRLGRRAISGLPASSFNGAALV